MVILVPITIMVLACLLERFEAHTTDVRPRVRIRRPAATESAATESAPSDAAPSAPTAVALALVPGTDREADTPAALLDADTRELRRAS